jgi:hypothetical protein
MTLRNAGVLLALLLGPAVAQDDATAPGQRRVQVREAILRDRPSFLGKIVKRLPYEELVEIKERKAKTSWLRVRQVRGGAAGWIKEASLHGGATDLRAGKGGSERAGRTTRSLAGRGFNEGVERTRRARLKREGSSIEQGYRELDALLARRKVFSPDVADVPAFARQGELGGEE